jgi:hypothetical protein
MPNRGAALKVEDDNVSVYLVHRYKRGIIDWG